MDSIINNMVDVSIIVPAFNHAKYISQTFDSILAQRTGFKYEIVVGDDCSRDQRGNISLFAREMIIGVMMLEVNVISAG